MGILSAHTNGDPKTAGMQYYYDASTEANAPQNALERELAGRRGSMRDEVQRLNERTVANEHARNLRLGTMVRLQIARTCLHWAYMVLVIIFLVMYARERCPEFYADRNWRGLLQFLVVGSIMVAAPYVLLEGVILAYGMLGGSEKKAVRLSAG